MKGISSFFRSLFHKEPCIFCKVPTANANLWGEHFHYKCFREHERKKERDEEDKLAAERRVDELRRALREEMPFLESPYLSEESVGAVIRWFNEEFRKEALRSVPRPERMMLLHRLSSAMEEALTLFRSETKDNC